jgi:hypothetical protein
MLPVDSVRDDLVNLSWDKSLNINVSLGVVFGGIHKYWGSIVCKAYCLSQ